MKFPAAVACALATGLIDGIAFQTNILAINAAAVGIMDEISAEARVQGTGVERIGAAVSEMSADTRQNASFVQQTSDIANKQEHYARGLVDSVGGFRTLLPAAGD